MKKESNAAKLKQGIPELKRPPALPFPLVAIGASAGGLDAVRRLLRQLPPDTGMAFFYVQHLSPDHSSVLATLMSRETTMKVQEAKNNMLIEPNSMYVCTPNKEMVPAGNKIKLKARNNAELPYLPIDDFFCVVAKEYKENCIGIVLSGKANDGTRGLQAIKLHGGITFAQDSTAKYGSMPASAVKANVVDYILPPESIALELAAPGKNGYTKVERETEAVEQEAEAAGMEALLAILRKQTQMDFSHYKTNTIRRRVENRIQQCGKGSLKEYTAYVKTSSEDATQLYKDLFIHVTAFFRDPDAFTYLYTTCLPQLLNSKTNPGDELRIWVVACSTGEEAYSLAMILSELRDKRHQNTAIKIFATDISEQAVSIARIGEYAARSMKGVSDVRLKRFFNKTGDYYRVKKEIRDMCLFATHNVLSDPPFSKIDLISCCNLLIYLDPSAQKKVLTTINFSLSSDGLLMLGKSETANALPGKFEPLTKKFRVYSRKETAGGPEIPSLMRGPRRQLKPAPAEAEDKRGAAQATPDLNSVIDQQLLEGYMPACAVVNRDMDILQFRGSAAVYLRHPQGKASLNILKMTRPELAYDLRVAMNTALKTGKKVSRTGISINTGSDTTLVTLDILPMPSPARDPLLLVVFTPETTLPYDHQNTKGEKQEMKDRHMQKLKDEVDDLRREMTGLIEAYETATESLQMANEESVSSNEEFQTLNEELETSKEEIEAANEELLSTNQELAMRNDLLVESYNYSEAIISTIHEPMLVLNKDLTVKSANESFYNKFKVKRSETAGQSIYDLGDKQWDIPQLHERFEHMQATNTGFHNFEVTHTFKEIGEKVMLLNAHRIEQKSSQEQLILFAIEDITELTRQQRSEKDALRNDIHLSREQNELLERAVLKRTKEIEKAQQVLEKKNAELIMVNKDLTSFTYLSTHDLPEPLRKIQLFISGIVNEKEQQLSKKGGEFFRRMQESARRMQQLLDDLITYSQAKDVDLVYEVTDLNKLVEKAREELLPLTEEKQANITAGKLGKLPVIPAQFGVLLSHIVANSLKFNRPGQPLEIKISSEVVPAKEIPGTATDLAIKYCHISVADNGIGFDQQYSDHIFEIFKRLHGADEYEGTGIGLAICKRIVENHNGVITATGKVDEGARVDIYIPTEQPTPSNN